MFSAASFKKHFRTNIVDRWALPFDGSSIYALKKVSMGITAVFSLLFSKRGYSPTTTK